MKYSIVVSCLLAIAPMSVTLAQDATAPASATTEATNTTPATDVVEAPAANGSPMKSVVGQPEAGKAQIVFFRASKFTGSAIKVAVYEGDKPLGVLKSGTYFVVSAEPGKHEYAVNAKGKDPLPMELDAGETYYVNGSISMGFVKGNSNLSPSDAAGYQADLPKLKKLGN